MKARRVTVRLTKAEIDGLDRLLAPEINKTHTRIIELRDREEPDEQSIKVLEFHADRLASASLALSTAMMKEQEREHRWWRVKRLFKKGGHEDGRE